MKLLCSPLFRKISSSVQTQFLTCRLRGSCTASAFGTSKGLPSQSGANSACVTYPLPSKSFKLQEITHNSKKKVSGHLKCCPHRPMLFFFFFSLCFKSNRSQLGKTLALLSHPLPAARQRIVWHKVKQQT